MNKIHFKIDYDKGKGEFAVCFIKANKILLSDDWNRVDCKRCIKVRDDVKKLYS